MLLASRVVGIEVDVKEGVVKLVVTTCLSGACNSRGSSRSNAFVVQAGSNGIVASMADIASLKADRASNVGLTSSDAQRLNASREVIRGSEAVGSSDRSKGLSGQISLVQVDSS